MILIYIARNCRVQREVAILQSSNRFEVLKSRVMNIEEGSGEEIKKDIKMVLREKRLMKKKEGNC